MKSPIIDRADLQTLQHRTMSGVLTLVFWAIWFYMWLPMLALIAWSLGIQQAYKYMVVLGGYNEVMRLIGIYSLVIAIMGGTLITWAAYNILRYGGIERRLGNRSTTIEQSARYFRQGPNAVQSWREAQRLYVVHDADGGIARVDILIPGMPVPDKQNDPVPDDAPGQSPKTAQIPHAA